MPKSLLVRRILRVLLGLFLGSIVVLGYTAYMWWTVGQQQQQHAELFTDTVLAAPAFDLVDQNGNRFTDKDLTGKVWVADFIFTNCPDFCPVLTANMLRLQRQLAAEGLLGQHVMLVSFSVDPIADTPPVLRRYADMFGANHDAWRFLTGPYEYMDEVLVNGFFVPVDHIHHDGGPDDVHAVDYDAHAGDHDTHADGHDRLAGGHDAQVVDHDKHGGTHDALSHAHDAHEANEAHHHVHDAHHEVPPPYTIMHSNLFVLVDRHGNVQAYHDGEQLDLDALMEDIRTLVLDR